MPVMRRIMGRDMLDDRHGPTDGSEEAEDDERGAQHENSQISKRGPVVNMYAREAALDAILDVIRIGGTQQCRTVLAGSELVGWIGGDRCLVPGTFSLVMEAERDPSETGKQDDNPDRCRTRSAFHVTYHSPGLKSLRLISGRINLPLAPVPSLSAAASSGITNPRGEQLAKTKGPPGGAALSQCKSKRIRR
jgi:hypothetical protein